MADTLTRFCEGRTDLIFDLTAQGHPAGGKDTNGTPLISWAAYYGDVTAVRYLQNQGADLNLLGENFDLNGAAFHGHWQLCQFLLEQGANADHALADTGETPLHAALCKADRGNYNYVVAVLLKHGADPNAKTKFGVETGGFMRDCRTRGESPLHRAAAFADEACLKMLLAAGADKTQRDGHGDSPLTWASYHLRPGSILDLLCFQPHRINPIRKMKMTSDHGRGWGNGMEIFLLGNPEP